LFVLRDSTPSGERNKENSTAANSRGGVNGATGEMIPSGISNFEIPCSRGFLGGAKEDFLGVEFWKEGEAALGLFRTPLKAKGSKARRGAKELAGARTGEGCERLSVSVKRLSRKNRRPASVASAE
jgi:hypothetical protein